MDPIAHYNAPAHPAESVIANEGGYVHEHPQGQLAVEMDAISPEARIATHGKSCICTKDLAYFAKIKKSSKIWEHGVGVLEVGTWEEIWLRRCCVPAASCGIESSYRSDAYIHRF